MTATSTFHPLSLSLLMFFLSLLSLLCVSSLLFEGSRGLYIVSFPPFLKSVLPNSREFNKNRRDPEQNL